MSTTLTYGHKLPADGDKGSTFFDDLESNIAIDDAHTHDGVTSSLLPTSSISNTTQSIASGSWVLVSDGLYRQLVTTPASITLGARGIFFIDSSGNFLNLSIEPQTSATYYVYINDNTLDLTAIYV